MRAIICLALFSFGLVSACNSGKQATSVAGTPDDLDGTWVLNYISGPRIAFEGLYPNKRPEINISIVDKRVTGNTGCNSFSGPFKVEANKIGFSEDMAMTRMVCPGEGETVFLQTLKKINTYALSGRNTLTLIMEDIALMRFIRK